MVWMRTLGAPAEGSQFKTVFQTVPNGLKLFSEIKRFSGSTGNWLERVCVCLALFWRQIIIIFARENEIGGENFGQARATVWIIRLDVAQMKTEAARQTGRLPGCLCVCLKFRLRLANHTLCAHQRFNEPPNSIRPLHSNGVSPDGD